MRVLCLFCFAVVTRLVLTCYCQKHDKRHRHNDSNEHSAVFTFTVATRVADVLLLCAVWGGLRAVANSSACERGKRLKASL